MQPAKSLQKNVVLLADGGLQRSTLSTLIPACFPDSVQAQRRGISAVSFNIFRQSTQRQTQSPAFTDFEGEKLLWHTSASHLKKYITNWEKNRKPDLVRVAALRQYQTYKQFVPGILYTFTRYANVWLPTLMTLSGGQLCAPQQAVAADMSAWPHGSLHASSAISHQNQHSVLGAQGFKCSDKVPD